MSGLFLALLNISITACWLVLAALLFRLLFKKAPKWTRCVLWGLVAVRLILPFTIESRLSLVPNTEPVSREVISSITTRTETPSAYAESPSIAETPANVDKSNETASIAVPNANTPAQTAPADNTAPAQSGTKTPENATTAPSAGVNTPTYNTPKAPATLEKPKLEPEEVALTVASVVWLIGLLAMLGYALVGYIRMRRKVKEAMPVSGNIFICDHIGTPFILGVFKPRIYLPSDVSGSDAALVIAHENAHIARRDYIWKPLGFILLAVYWFNPAIWLAYILLCRDIELACDERVISSMGDNIKKDYSSALVNCSMPRHMIAAYPLAFAEVGVKGRVKNVLKFKKTAVWITVIAIIACAAVAVGFLTSPIKAEKTDQTKKINLLTDTVTFAVDEVIYRGERSWLEGLPAGGGEYDLSYAEDFADAFTREFIELGDKILLRVAPAYSTGSAVYFCPVFDDYSNVTMKELGIISNSETHSPSFISEYGGLGALIKWNGGNGGNGNDTGTWKDGYSYEKLLKTADTTSDRFVQLMNANAPYSLLAEKLVFFADNDGNYYLLRGGSTDGWDLFLAYIFKLKVIEPSPEIKTENAPTTHREYATIEQRVLANEKYFVPENGSTEYVYNEWGDIAEKKHGDGTRLVYSYDNALRLTKVVTLKGENSITGSETYEYDSNGNKVKYTVIYGSYITAYNYEYNSDGLLVKMTVSGSENRTTEYSYDENGRIVSEVTNHHDTAFGNFSTKVVTVYNDDGSYQKATTFGNGKVSVGNYSSDGKIVSVHENNVQIAGYTYDVNGNILKYEAYDGEKIVEYENYTYDENGNLTEKEYGMNNAVETQHWTEYYEYNEYGELIKQSRTYLNGKTYVLKECEYKTITVRVRGENVDKPVKPAETIVDLKDDEAFLNDHKGELENVVRRFFEAYVVGDIDTARAMMDSPNNESLALFPGDKEHAIGSMDKIIHYSTELIYYRYNESAGTGEASIHVAFADDSDESIVYMVMRLSSEDIKSESGITKSWKVTYFDFDA